MCVHVWTQKWIDPFRCLSLTESKAESGLQHIRTFASLNNNAGDHPRICRLSKEQGSPHFLKISQEHVSFRPEANITANLTAIA
jgi:hypothetical protein